MLLCAGMFVCPLRIQPDGSLQNGATLTGSVNGEQIGNRGAMFRIVYFPARSNPPSNVETAAHSAKLARRADATSRL
jgi:hypothetical protein